MNLQLTGRLARTHSKPLTWQQVIEEALGEIGLHPWEFYEYSFDEYLAKRKGHDRVIRREYQQRAISSLLPWMDGKDRKAILGQILKGDGKAVSKKSYKELIAEYRAAGAIK